MPVLMMWGFPQKTSENDFRDLRDTLIGTVSRIMDLEEESVTFLFPSNRITVGIGEEIVVFVDGLYLGPDCTKETQHEIAQKIGWAIKDHYPDADVKCFIRPFDPGGGFWKST